MEKKIPYWQSTKCPLKIRGVRPKFTHLSEDDIGRIVGMYESGNHTYSSIARHFNRCLSSIGRVLNKRGYKAVDPSLTARKYSVNENYFDEINTEGKAYFLGFLYADGTNNEQNNQIILSLQRGDSYIIKALLDEVGSNRPIKEYEVVQNGVVRYYSKGSIANRQMSQSLSKHGCGQSKTFIIKFPENIDIKIIHHFVRGYFDGDGCFGVSKKSKSNMCLSITSNKIFLYGLQSVMEDILGLNRVKISEVSNKNRLMGVLAYSGRNNCIKIRDWMYSDATIYLNRKYDRLYSI